ncbi:hypothetical protein V6N12_016000 [Hibiscus sabdariffa]|uniref:Uncharacterized protein n=1 Tax=Hibiscus sabdariffa TaxID=183260 RepID=A0ABR2DPT8_9ROSI
MEELDSIWNYQKMCIKLIR